MPEIIFEIRSTWDRWREIHKKVAEYLSAGVSFGVVLDPEPQTAHLFTADEPPRTLQGEEELIFPGILEGFSVRVSRFFE